MAQKYGLKLYETPVGCKYITTLMLNEDILIEMVAAYGRTLGQLLNEMMEELGWFYYDREDLHLEIDKKERLMKALTDNPPETLDGLEVLSSNISDGWVSFKLPERSLLCASMQRLMIPTGCRKYLMKR